MEFLRACQQDLAKPSMLMSVVLPCRQDTCIAPVHIQHKKAQAFKVTTPSSHKSTLCYFFLHSGPLSTMLVIEGNCFFFFFSDSTLETLGSLFEGVYEILEVEFMSAML